MATITVEKLKKSPIFAMSLGSKELFHSNFWAWLIEVADNDFASVFFPALKGKITVKREENNRDLTIHLENSNLCYVIENKIKSIPTKEQLKKYKDDLDGNFGGGILTGIKPTLELENDWKFLSYEDISKGIRKKISEKKNVIYKDLILDYCDFVESISELVKNALDSEKSKGKLVYDCEELESIRMADVYKKFKAEDFLDFFNKNYAKDLKVGDYELDLSTGFSHSDAMIDVFLKKGDFSIGVEIQNGAFQRIVEKKCDPDKIFEEYLSTGWFETYSGKKIFGKDTSQKGKFCKFDKKNGVYFVYQYYNITDTDYDSLSKAIFDDIKKAVEII